MSDIIRMITLTRGYKSEFNVIEDDEKINKVTLHIAFENPIILDKSLQQMFECIEIMITNTIHQS